MEEGKDGLHLGCYEEAMADGRAKLSKSGREWIEATKKALKISNSIPFNKKMEIKRSWEKNRLTA